MSMRTLRPRRVVAVSAVAATMLTLVGCGSAPAGSAQTGGGSATVSPSESVAEPPPEPDRTGGPRIPAGFPLAAGWPDDSAAEPGQDGLLGPSRHLDSFALTACGKAAPDLPYADRLRADWSDVEDHRGRQLTTYADEPRAAEAVAALVGHHHACPRDPDEESGALTEWEVRRLDVGQETWALIGRASRDGAPVPFGTTTVVARINATVLVATAVGHAGDASGSALDRTIRQVRPVLDAMESLSPPDVEDLAIEPSFGPDGFLRVRLGMSREELLALPDVTLTGGGQGPCEGFEAPGVTGEVQPDLGVATLTLTADVGTPERLGVGSGLAALRRVHPAGRLEPPHYVTAVPDHDDRHYRFRLDRGGRVQAVTLVLVGERCSGLGGG